MFSLYVTYDFIYSFCFLLYVLIIFFWFFYCLGKLTEIYGNSGSGKTQLCLQLAINVSLPQTLGGLEGESIYIETNKSVFPCRLGEMIQAFVEHVKLNLEFKMKIKTTNQTKERKVQHIDDMRDHREKTKELLCDDGNRAEIETTRNNALKRKRSLGECSGNPNERDGKFENTANRFEKIENTAGRFEKFENTAGRFANTSATESVKTETKSVTNRTSCNGTDTDDSLNKTNNGLAVNNDDRSKEFKVNMSRSDLKKFMKQSKTSTTGTNLNQFLHSKIPVTKPSEISPESVLSKIHIHYCANFYETVALVLNIESYIKRKSPGKVKLIIIDNITFLFHNEHNSNYLKRTKNIYFLLNLLGNLAETHNLAVVLVNQLTTKYSANDRKVVPALGETFAHKMQVRLLMQRFQLGLGGHGVGGGQNGGKDVDLEDETGALFMCLIDKMSVQNEAVEDKKHVVFQINAQGVRDV
uniref:DNA repair protein RAD51 homolog 3 n=1 Tax=Cacopsylla melanoneura TaxID=428564 RepID=A0A8D9F6X4_9HEMI